jgi:rRNA maturation RNase YbeY
MSSISFFSEEIPFKLSQKRWLKQWINSVISSENKKVGTISYIFCNDAYLIQLNRQYLQHDTLTDVITFDYTVDNDGLVSGDIFISIERVKDNATELNLSFNEELQRVMIHGVLHLLGYKDKTKAEKQQMRQKEDYSLSLQNK